MGGARRALEISGSSGVTSPALISALKMAIGEAFMAAYDASTMLQPPQESLKHSGGIYHYLQWLFDLQFIRMSLSDTPSDAASQAGDRSGADPARATYEALVALLDRTEAVALADAVDRTLYQPVLKSAVKSHVQGVRMLLNPYYMFNPLYGYHFQSKGSGASDGVGSAVESEGFDIQATFAPPLRPTLPRFPLLPVATASALASVSSGGDLQGRLGAQPSGLHPGARPLPPGSAGGVSALSQQVGSAFEAIGASGLSLGKAGQGLLGFGSNWATAAMGGGKPEPKAV